MEKATFFNVLERIEKSSDVYKGKKVFINSIPGNRLVGEDEKRLESILKRHADTVVVELTEQTELSDEALADRLWTYFENGKPAIDELLNELWLYGKKRRMLGSLSGTDTGNYAL